MGIRREIAVGQVRHEVPGAVRPPQVQVLDEEARRHHAYPVVHPPGRGQLAHPGVDEREAGAPLLPGLEPGAGFVVGHPGHRAQVAPRRVRPMPQDVGVELAPGQLGDEGRRAGRGRHRGGGEVGQQGARVDLAELQRLGQPRGAVQIRSVAALAVVGDSVGQEGRPARAGLGLARRVGHRGAHGLHARLPGQRRQVIGGDVAQPDESARRGCRSRRPVRTPRLGERREHPVCRSGPGPQGARTNRVCRARCHEVAPRCLQRGPDVRVSTASVGRGLGADVHRCRTHLGRQGRDHRRWRADPDDQLRGIPVAQVGVERAEGGEQPDPPAAARGRPQERVEDEERNHGGAVGSGGQESRVVRNAQVAPNPPHARVHR